MARRAFYSFHYKPDNWRVSQVRNIGAVEGNAPASDNDWETVTKGGEDAIKRWINDQMSGRGCTIVLIGAATAGRKWINYEIEKSWTDGKGVLGVYIHNLRDVKGNQTTKGNNPFSGFNVGNVSIASIVNAYDPPYFASKDVYAYIEANLETWIEEAVKIRAKY
jgi:hypothetical protein